MRNLPGLAFAVIAIWFSCVAVTQRASRLAARRAAGIPDDAEPTSRMYVFGAIMRPIILFFLAFLGIKATFAYFWLDAARFLSLLDLGAFLAALMAYGFWVIVKTKYPPLALFAQVDDRGESSPGRLADPDQPGGRGMRNGSSSLTHARRKRSSDRLSWTAVTRPPKSCAATVERA
jgi:hypothetical protein